MMDFEIVVIGLGYVGLGLAVECGKVKPTLGIDVDKDRVAGLIKGIDINGEVKSTDLEAAKFLKFDNQLRIKQNTKRIYLITVPTPVDEFNKPDLSYLEKASKELGACLQKGDILIYESTTFPTCTREVCIPILERTSKLICDVDFGVGFCPERVDPGQDKKALNQIVRVISASNSSTLATIEELYHSIGQKTHRVSSLEVAEMSKLAENCQRDLNISFVNELALICDKLGIKTSEVLSAAATKWNFHPYQPGLVGGHCISVDPYYLIHKAESLQYFPKLIGAGREVNEAMPAFIAAKCIKLMIQKGIAVKGAKALILGLTFKENCSDTRNSKVYELIKELKEYGLSTTSYDPFFEKECPSLLEFDLIIHAVAHAAFTKIDFSTRKKQSVLFDIKGTLADFLSDGSL